MASVYQSLSWKSKKDYQLILALEAIMHGMAELYFSTEDTNHADYFRISHITPKEIFEHVAGFPCPEHLDMKESLSAQEFKTDMEKTAFTIGYCWKRANHATKGNIQATRTIMEILREKLKRVTEIFTTRTHNKAARIAQLHVDCAWINSNIPEAVKARIAAYDEE